MKKIILCILAAVLVSINSFATDKYSSAPVTWYDTSSHMLMTSCTVNYYVENNILYIDKEFKTLSFIYSDKDKKTILKHQSLYFNHNQKKGNFWYVRLNSQHINKPSNSYLSGIILRNCQTEDQRNKTGVCMDAYLYNITKEINHKKGSQTLTPTLSEIYKHFK